MRVPLICALLVSAVCAKTDSLTTARLISEKINVLGMFNKTSTNESAFSYFIAAAANETLGKLQIIADLEQQLEIDNQMKGKLCMRNLTDCMANDPDYEMTMRQLTKLLLGASPPFDLSTVEGVSEDCQKASHRFVTDLRNYQLWALGMYDATAKLPSGLLSGNVNQLGDFDLCMWSKLSEEQIYGQYCLAAIQVETPHSPYLSAVHNRLYAHQSFKSKLGDPGHRVPRFSSINWGMCTPSQCTAKDVELGFRKTVDAILGPTDLEYKMEVDAHMCTSSKPKTELNYGFIFGSVFFLGYLIFAFIATAYDHYSTCPDKNEIFVAFSLKKNILSMISIERQGNDLEAVHGIRFINAIMLLLSHKSMALLFLPYVNRTEMSETIGQPWTVIGRAASLYTDPFLMLSATLTTYSIVGRLQRNVKISFIEEYAARLFRIVPTLGALILFCTFVLPYIAAGPMWNLVVTHHSDICKQYWWRNLMFIHNYFGFKNMCLTHTHHVGIDTQLFFLSPFLIMLLWKWPKRGIFTLITIATLSTIGRYYITNSMKLSNYIHFGTSIEQLFNTADYMYILPPHRLTVYIMGIFLGYLLRNSKHIILKPAQIHIGNILALVSFVASFIGPAFMGSIDYIYQPVHAAWYAAFAPILWCFTFAWIIFTSHLGYQSRMGRIFSFPYFRLWTKISYTVYLTQFPIFFFNVGTTRHSEQYQFIQKNLNILEMAWIFGVSILMTLLFESPFINIKNSIFKRKDKTKAMKSPEPAKKKIS